MDFEFTKTGFVADAIIAHLRNGNYPTDEEAVFLDRIPIIDLLRQRVFETDFPFLLDAIKRDSGPAAGFACSLLRKYAQQEQVKSLFQVRWASATTFLKNRLIWRLLDDPDLSQEWHKSLRDFVFDEWASFRDFNLKFLGTSHQGICNIISRIGDPSFPKSKKWIYLCCIPTVVESREAAQALLNMGKSLSDPFARETAEEVLQRFLPDTIDDISDQKPAQKVNELGSPAFVADAVISYLRKGNLPTEKEADYLNRLPIIDRLRSRITQSDLSLVLDVIDKESGEIAGLYLSFLRNFDLNPDIQAHLRKKWETATPFLKAHLMWRILDDSSLPVDWHEKLFDFVLNEWKTFQMVSLKFLGSSETVILQALKRIGDSGFPDSKKWAYLCRVPEVAEDQEAARALVNLGLSLKDPFTRKVAKVLLERFFQERAVEAASV